MEFRGQTLSRFASALAALLLAAGCAKVGQAPSTAGAAASPPLTAAQSMDQQGNCTLKFVNAFNAVVTQGRLAQLQLASGGGSTTDSKTLKAVAALSNACAALGGAQVSPVSCSALVAQQKQLVSSLSLQPVCGATRNAARVGPVLPLPPSQGGSSGPSGTTGISGGGPSGGAAGASGQPPQAIPAGWAQALAQAPLPPQITLVPHSATATAALNIAGTTVCSGAFAAAYVNLAQTLATAAPSTATAVAQQCAQFFTSLAAPVQCYARLDGIVQTISSETLRARCSTATGLSF